LTSAVDSERGGDNLVGAVFGDNIVETGILKHLGSCVSRGQNG
jgi:hypothetical protein